jgi:hypothetical protein
MSAFEGIADEVAEPSHVGDVPIADIQQGCKQIWARKKVCKPANQPTGALTESGADVSVGSGVGQVRARFPFSIKRHRSSGIVARSNPH